MTIREISKDVRKNESVALPGVRYTCEMKNDKRRLKTGKNNNAHPQYWTEHINRPSYRQQKESGFENRKKKHIGVPEQVLLHTYRNLIALYMPNAYKIIMYFRIHTRVWAIPFRNNRQPTMCIFQTRI